MYNEAGTWGGSLRNLDCPVRKRRDQESKHLTSIPFLPGFFNGDISYLNGNTPALNIYFYVREAFKTQN